MKQTSRLEEPEDVIELDDYVSISDAEKFHIRSYWRVLVERRRLVGVIFLTVFALGLYVTNTATPLYTAVATLQIDPQAPTLTGLGDFLNAQATQSGGDYFQTQFALLGSRSVAASVISELGLASDRAFTSIPIVTSSLPGRLQGWLFFIFRQAESAVSWITTVFTSMPPSKAPPKPIAAAPSVTPVVNAGLINRYMGFLTIKPVKNTRLVQIEFTTPDPQLAQNLANAHAKAFIRLNFHSRLELTKDARDYLDKKNSELRAKLEESEEALNRFRQTHGIVSLDKGENAIVDRLLELNRELTRAQADRLQAESLYRVVQNKDPQYISEVTKDATVQGLKSSLVKLEADKARLSTVYKTDHPQMVELGVQINDTRRALTAELNAMVRTIESTFVVARARESALQDEAQKQQKRALDLKELGVQYVVLQEDVNVSRSLYESVLKRLSETTVSNDLALSNLQITEQAEKPSSPSAPKPQQMLLLSLAAGLILSIGIAFFMDYLDSSIKSSQDIWTYLYLPTLGIVPRSGSLHRWLPGHTRESKPAFLSYLSERWLDSPGLLNRSLLIHEAPFSMIAESYRSIRTRLLQSNVSVILTTSAQPGEGKTVSTINLGVSLANKGHSVLVIDADLRKGVCHRLLNCGGHPGLSEVLAGTAETENTLKPTAITGLSFLPRGKCPSSPADLLSGNRMKELIDTFRRQFDFVVIDCPPAIAVSDAAIISTLCDGVVFVVRSQYTSRETTRRAMECIKGSRTPIVGVILNAVDFRAPDYYDYRHYYSYYTSNIDDADEWKPAPPLVPVVIEQNNSSLTTQTETSPKSGDFIDLLIRELTEYLGPMAKFIVRDHVNALGESSGAFPKARCQELLDTISREIPDANNRNDFRIRLALHLSTYPMDMNSMD